MTIHQSDRQTKVNAIGIESHSIAVKADGMYCLNDLHKARNTGTVDLPFAVGFHTYLRVGASPVDDCTLELGAEQWQPLGPRLLPDGPPRTVASSMT